MIDQKIIEIRKRQEEIYQALNKKYESTKGTIEPFTFWVITRSAEEGNIQCRFNKGKEETKRSYTSIGIALIGTRQSEQLIRFNYENRKFGIFQLEIHNVLHETDVKKIKRHYLNKTGIQLSDDDINEFINAMQSLNKEIDLSNETDAEIADALYEAYKTCFTTIKAYDQEKGTSFYDILKIPSDTFETKRSKSNQIMATVLAQINNSRHNPTADPADKTEPNGDGESDNVQTDELIMLPLNLILYGPPGTGKTHHTIDKSLEIIDGRKTHNADRFEELKGERRIEFITFHQSISYEDFIEGIKPITKGNNVTYRVKPSIFKQICERAEQDSGNNYVLIIDEINRGNVANIFGELITLIENNKREKLKVTLPYSNEEFSVPKNLYIIGTMNTADRSVEALDTALRRRFSFEEMMPDSNLLKDYIIKTNDFEHCTFANLLETINKRIEVLKDRDHLIGHSYFMIKDEKENDIKEIDLNSQDNSKILKNVFFDKIIPLLQEYFYGDYEKIQLVLGKGFIDEKTVEINNLFAGGKTYDGVPEKLYHIKSKDEIDMTDALKSMSILNWEDENNPSIPQQPPTIQPSATDTFENESQS